MLNLAIIGTNWITEKFIDASHQSGEFTLKAIYSRQLKHAEFFAKNYQQTEQYDDLVALAHATNIDAVYIASPNSLHYQQALLMLKNGKHVICEKPLASNLAQVEEMYQVAKENNVILFEAFKTPFLPNFQVIKDNLAQLGSIRHGLINYCQYSSRYQKYLNGENPNTFNPRFSNGSIMDIGYYCLGAAIELFGRPNSVKAEAFLLESGVDGNGSVILNYGDFNIVILHSKVSDSKIDSEIQGESGSLVISHISECDSVTLMTREGKTEQLMVPQEENSMIYEAQAFADQINANNPDLAAQQRSLIVAEILTEIRQQTGVLFPADQV
ncbi:Gfo/Idh/MocA family oxidoreductase [Vibrio sp. SS-MA-C1-2]|uniref:Gfo/Idh/MocA family protein n=1 Tax=Vibrio sp. SS-MA-C1-2 TaxID=2908646 RepID=UPI001F44722E|nr:Gfo/Idh/MocA family oxidoreductase [Vibrio sp. SS-MA-C1-2]UJF16916.1 Gfo/Idh/MocA family oxidoreductase [Vibrio sp. SS-MA-C1-2]